MTETTFPPGVPPELAAQSFTKGSEAAWRPEFAPKVVEWLGQNGFAVLGTELWIVRDDRIQPGIIVNGVREIHGNAISRMQSESWDAYVSRSAQETLRYLSSFGRPRVPVDAAQIASQRHQGASWRRLEAAKRSVNRPLFEVSKKSQQDKSRPDEQRGIFLFGD
jgi:hypothetical protein